MGLGETMHHAGNLEEGQELLQRALEMAIARGDDLAEARTRYALGATLRLRSLPGESLAQLGRARELLSGLGEERRLAKVLTQLGTTYTHGGDWELAASVFEDLIRGVEEAT